MTQKNAILIMQYESKFKLQFNSISPVKDSDMKDEYGLCGPDIIENGLILSRSYSNSSIVDFLSS